MYVSKTILCTFDYFCEPDFSNLILAFCSADRRQEHLYEGEKIENKTKLLVFGYEVVRNICLEKTSKLYKSSDDFFVSVNLLSFFDFIGLIHKIYEFYEMKCSE